jgi:16S rRNA C967 or C1407 C5-methylase (RsmB/RsmF family)
MAWKHHKFSSEKNQSISNIIAIENSIELTYQDSVMSGVRCPLQASRGGSMLKNYREKLRVLEEIEMAYIKARNDVADAKEEIEADIKELLLEIFSTGDIYDVELKENELKIVVKFSNIEVDELIERLAEEGLMIKKHGVNSFNQGIENIFTFSLPHYVDLRTCFCRGQLL